LSDRLGTLRAYWLASAGQTAMVFWFTQISSPPMFYLAGLMFGFGYGGVMTCLILCAQGFVPTARRGISTGIVAGFAFLGMGIGGYAGGLLFDITGDYTMSYAFAAISGMVNLLTGGALYVYQSRRIAELKLQGETA
jgi:MFS family permease